LWERTAFHDTYGNASPIASCSRVHKAVREFLEAYFRQSLPPTEASRIAGDAALTLERDVAEDAAPIASDLLKQPRYVVCRLWSSTCKVHGDREFCSILNEALRKDILTELVVPVVRTMNQF
jgi:hypothetical protein